MEINENYLKFFFVSQLKKHFSIDSKHAITLIDELVNSLIVRVQYSGEIIRQLEMRIVHFQYMKTDGSIREAWGTLRNDLIPPRQFKSIKSLDVNPRLVHYFDLEKDEWRQFKSENFISIL